MSSRSSRRPPTKAQPAPVLAPVGPSPDDMIPMRRDHLDAIQVLLGERPGNQSFNPMSWIIVARGQYDAQFTAVDPGNRVVENNQPDKETV